jgi:hypothetical protein
MSRLSDSIWSPTRTYLFSELLQDCGVGLVQLVRHVDLTQSKGRAKGNLVGGQQDYIAVVFVEFFDELLPLS